MGQIRISDEVARQLKEISDGRSMSVTIQMLLKNKNDNNELKQIKNRLSNIETAIRNINFSAHNQPQAQPMVIPPFPDQTVRQEAVYNTQSSNVQPEIPDRTYAEIIEEMKQIQEELETLDDDDPRRKELLNKLRADNVESNLLEDD